MACGRTARNEYTVASRTDSSTHVTDKGSNSIVDLPLCRGSCSQNAVLFLQKEHEQILNGLHNAIKDLQQKCDGFQFEIHLRHASSSGLAGLEKKLSEANEDLKEKNAKLQELENEVAMHEEEKQQLTWRQLQLRQQTESAESRNSELKEQLVRCKAQIKDLKIYNSALRSRTNNGEKSFDCSKTGATSPSRTTDCSNYSLESLSSEDCNRSINGSLGYCYTRRTFKESRAHSSPPNSFQCSSASPSRGLTLPPIAQPQTLNRPHIRKQLRLLSAPAIQFSYPKAKLKSHIPLS